jgi:hypothetical protein
LEAVPRSLSRHVRAGDPMELLVDERDQPVECRIITLSPRDQEPRDVGR